MSRAVLLVEYECPACATTYELPVNTRRYCPSCQDDIGESHLLMPADVLRKRLAEIKAKKGSAK